MVQLLIAGFILGSMSSFHCVGMCGPLALSLPVQHLPGWQKSGALLLYHAGRISMYALFGLIFGLAGHRIYVAGFQQWFSVGLGIFMLMMAVQYFALKHASQPVLITKFYYKIQKRTIFLWKSPGSVSFFLLGMANGLLPCGMVYLAIAGALNASQVNSSILFMIMFGLGTLPPLFALSYFGSVIKLSFRNRIKQMTPFVVATMAVILILRGLNLGIPFISPMLGAARLPEVSCH